jgi:glutathione S-transferase
MIIVHHLADSRSQRILWLLEELKLEYEIEHYARDAKTSLAPESLKKVHPLGRSPVISDGDTIVAESGAIIEYLVDNYGESGLIPEIGTPERLKYTYWLHYAEGTLMPLLLLKLVFDRMSGPPVPLLIRPVSTLIAAGFKGRFIMPRLKENLD